MLLFDLSKMDCRGLNDARGFDFNFYFFNAMGDQVGVSGPWCEI